ncbi:MAG: twin-arginine translocase subunit TatC [Patescibacteria group bacterium]|nr:MAG: twin-arginine translocase subunit TatC [Patescibacteria group bacterium]
MAKGSAINPELQKVINKNLPFLMEIRRRILFTASVFLVFSFLGFFYYEKIIKSVFNLLNLPAVNIVFTSPFQYMELAINCGVAVGLVISFPLIIWQLLSFLKPALKPKEFRIILLLLPVSLALFAGGFGVGIWMMRYVVSLSYQKSVELSIGTLLDISSLLSKIIVTSSLMGIAFQFPIVMTALMQLNIVKTKKFAKQRPLIYTLAIIFAALMPPTDIFSLLLLTLPLVILFELTLLLNKLVKPEKGRGWKK